jgi:hypothetical protein
VRRKRRSRDRTVVGFFMGAANYAGRETGIIRAVTVRGRSGIKSRP